MLGRCSRFIGRTPCVIQPVGAEWAVRRGLLGSYRYPRGTPSTSLSDPELAEVAAELGAALVCTHTGGAVPRTRPHRVSYGDVVAQVVSGTVAYAERAVSLGVNRDSILIDPVHDFGKNTWHSLELTRRLDEMTASGWPVLVSLSNKDFVGESLGLPVGERLSGTLAATAISAWQRARVYRAHRVVETRQVLDMVATIGANRLPARVVRGLA